MERTKTGRRLRIPLPPELMEILQEHVGTLPDGPMRESELLFPSTSGGYRAPSCLDKPIREIASAAKIGKALTRRFMRGTFQDLGRAASVHDFVVRAISGHATTSMQEHYSSVSGDEVRGGLEKLIVLAGISGKGLRDLRPEALTEGDVDGEAAAPAVDEVGTEEIRKA